MKIENIMSREIIVGNITDSLYDIAILMKKYNIGFIPIAKGRQIIGVITDRDIVINAISNKVKLDSCVADYMSLNIIAINKDDDILKALDIISFKKVKRLIVIDNNKVVGIVSLADLIKDDDISCKEFLNCFKKLWEIYDSVNLDDLEIDEFYL
ncbi:MAG: CBS domain-containing protein [Bacilli bacterium]